MTRIGAWAAGVLLVLVVLPVLITAAVLDEEPPAGLNAAGIPPAAADAYVQAASTVRERGYPDCLIPPWIIAGVGRIETNHGQHLGSAPDAHGTVRPPILGLVLDGSAGTAEILDTDGGAHDGDTTYDRAVGPMQFIPSTWAAFAPEAGDANGDGIVDPHSLYDAALTAAVYLCAHGGTMSTVGEWERAIFAYNHSDDYVASVLEAAYGYRPTQPAATPIAAGTATGCGAPVTLAYVEGIGLVAATLAPQLQALLAAAAGDGLALTGHSYRSCEQQVVLRRQNCGTSHEAIYEWPSSRCTPHTARPGTSQHELGLAVDFRSCSTTGTACYHWLSQNAAAFGLINYAPEPWHWSTTGR